MHDCYAYINSCVAGLESAKVAKSGTSNGRETCLVALIRNSHIERNTAKDTEYIYCHGFKLADLPTNIRKKARTNNLCVPNSTQVLLFYSKATIILIPINSYYYGQY